MRARRQDARAVAWWVLAGLAAGAVSGFLLGGLGGRLAMLVLRLTSPDWVTGTITDDGFEIGVLTLQTLPLLAVATGVGAFSGLAWVTVRGAVSRRLRVPLAAAGAAAIDGAALVHDDGIDFHILEPALLAVALFVAIPAAAGALMAWLVERWADREPFPGRRASIAVVLAAVSGTVALVPAAVVWLVAFALRRAGLAAPVTRASRVVVPVGIAALTVVAAVDLARETLRIV